MGRRRREHREAVQQGTKTPHRGIITCKHVYGFSVELNTITCLYCGFIPPATGRFSKSLEIQNIKPPKNRHFGK